MEMMYDEEMGCWGFWEGLGLGGVGLEEDVALLEVLEYVAVEWAALLVEY